MWMQSLRRRLFEGPTQRGPSRRARSTFPRPAANLRVELLEDRWCPSCDISVIRGHILDIRGDATDNQIGIVDDGHGDIRVVCGRTQDVTLTGIDQIMLITGDGNDVVNYQVGDPNGVSDPDERPAELKFDLGPGNDAVNLNALFSSQPPRTSNPEWFVAVNCGAGSDAVNFRLDGALSQTFQFHIDLGSGNSSFNLDTGSAWICPDDNTPQPPTIRVTGSTGDDQVTMRFEGANLGNLHIVADLGQGNSSFLVDAPAGWQSPSSPDVPPPQPAQPPTVRVLGGQGNDQILMRFGAIATDLSIRAELGAGDTTFAAFFMGIAEDSPQAITQAHVKLAVIAGAGNDNISASFVNGRGDFQPCIRPAFDVAFEGGSGNDTFAVTYANVNLDGPQNVRLVAGSGDDTLSVRTTGTVAVKAPLNAFQRGGPGHDSLQVDLAQMTLIAPVAVAINGGAGNNQINVGIDDPTLLGAANLNVAINGGPGNNQINVGIDDPTLLGAANLNVAINGGPGNDQIAFVFQGLLNGALNVRIAGGSGNDVINTQFLIDAASTGALDAAVLGGAGNDILTFDVFFVNADGTRTGDGHGRLASFSAVLDGGGGQNTLEATANVEIRNR